MTSSPAEKQLSRTQRITVWLSVASGLVVVLIVLWVLALARDQAIAAKNHLKAQDKAASSVSEVSAPVPPLPTTDTSSTEAVFWVSAGAFLFSFVLALLAAINRTKSIQIDFAKKSHDRELKKWVTAWQKTAAARDTLVAKWIHEEEEVTAQLGKSLFAHRYGFEVSSAGVHLNQKLNDMSHFDQLLPRYAPHLVGDHPPSIEELDLSYEPENFSDPDVPTLNPSKERDYDHD